MQALNQTIEITRENRLGAARFRTIRTVIAQGFASNIKALRAKQTIPDPKQAGLDWTVWS
jgi:hypothetical protein